MQASERFDGLVGHVRAEPISVHGSILEETGVAMLFIAPGSPWENGYAESFHSRMRDELLEGESFLHLGEMKYVVERW